MNIWFTQNGLLGGWAAGGGQVRGESGRGKDRDKKTGKRARSGCMMGGCNITNNNNKSMLT